MQVLEFCGFLDHYFKFVFDHFLLSKKVIFLIGVYETYMKLILADKVECFMFLCEVSWPSVIVAKCRPTFCT